MYYHVIFRIDTSNFVLTKPCSAYASKREDHLQKFRIISFVTVGFKKFENQSSNLIKILKPDLQNFRFCNLNAQITGALKLLPK